MLRRPVVAEAGDAEVERMAFGHHQQIRLLPHHDRRIFLRARAHQGERHVDAALIEAGDIRPVNDRVFPFEDLNDALAYIETGRAKGKVVVSLKGAAR